MQPSEGHDITTRHPKDPPARPEAPPGNSATDQPGRIKATPHKPIGRAAALLIATLTIAWITAVALGPAAVDAPYDSARYLGWIAAMILAGLAFAALCPALARHRSAKWLIFILLAGFAMRAASFATPPIIEDDYHRYLLDGAATAAWLDPFETSPEQLLAGEAGDAHLTLLEHPEARAHLERINHPHLRTIYPPTAQAAFAAAHFIEPWSVNALRAVFLFLEVVTLAALAAALGALRLPTLLLGIYWLNPIVIGQITLQAHMDVLVFAPVAAAVAARLRQHCTLAGVFLGLAIGAKLWPLLLLPALASPKLALTRKNSLRLAIATTITSALCLTPAASALGENSGLQAYTATWENNAFLFPIIEQAAAALTATLGITSITPGALARITVASIVGAMALAAARRGSEHALPRRLLTVVAALFFLSPTQFPWYFTWLAPLLVFAPRSALRLSVPLLPLYYLTPALAWLSAVQHAPPLLTAAAKRLLRPNR